VVFRLPGYRDNNSGVKKSGINQDMRSKEVQNIVKNPNVFNEVKQQ
jgi:hypothetical protein